MVAGLQMSGIEDVFMPYLKGHYSFCKEKQATIPVVKGDNPLFRL
jgi:hypothetical protein